MKINLKYINNSNNLKEYIECKDFENILDIKKNICQNTEIDTSQLKLIFLGKILKDEDSIKNHHIKNNVTIHVIIKEKINNSERNTNYSNAENQNTGNPFQNSNFTNIENIFNHLENTLQNEDFQNNITNTMNQFQQIFQNTLQRNEFQQDITSIANSLQQMQQNFQNTVENREFQNNIINTMNQFQQNMANSFTNTIYNQEQEEKISELLNLNIINNRNQIINLLQDNNWNQEEVANILLYHLY